MQPRLYLTVVLLLGFAPAGFASTVSRTLSADGSCEKLVVADEDMSAECGTALIQMHYDDGRVSLSAGTGGQWFFGLGEPERVLAFGGQGTGEPWTDHPVDRVIAADDAGSTLLFSVDASGACTYDQAPRGFVVTCEAEDDAGRMHHLSYRTDGWPGFEF